MSESPVCDLVLLSWNHLEQTQPCLESLFQSTTVPCRLLIVDNGSEPDVRAFLAGVKPRGAIREVALLQHETNEGFPRGMNRGIRESRAPFVCLLNNDLRFTAGWLEEMLAVARAHPDIGVMNPGSSNFGNWPPRGVSMEEHALAMRRRHAGVYTEVGMCIGFCMLVRREVIDRIGGLTEEVERIFFEDEDYSMRAQQAGFRCVVAEGAYVHHAEHQTLRPSPEREAVFQRNQRWCNERWGRRIRMAWPRFDLPARGSAELREWLTELVDWARRRTYVYTYVPVSNGMTKEDLFRSVGLVPHADVVWRPLPPQGSRWVAAMRVLKRRKKPFDVVVAPDPRWERTMRRLQWIHGAQVVLETEPEALVAEWKAKSRSPS